MTKLVWDETAKRLYETGVSHGVLYVMEEGGEYGDGVAWNGLTGVTQSPSGAEATPLYANNGKYLNLTSAEEFACTIEAYTYPDQFSACDGSADLGTAKGVTVGQQARKMFGFSYRTILGNDVEGNDYAYKINLVYGCTAAPSERAYETVNDSPEAMTMSWEVSTTPVNVTGMKPTSTITIDSTKADPTKLAELEKILYGDEMTEPRLPLPDEIATLMTSEE